MIQINCWSKTINLKSEVRFWRENKKRQIPSLCLSVKLLSGSNVAFRLLLFENRRALRRERIFRNRKNPLDHYDAIEMYTKYRFTRAGCIHIINVIGVNLQHPTMRKHALPPSLQVFIALRFYATGSLFDCVSEIHGCSISTCSRVLWRVTAVLCNLQNDTIKFPTTPVAVQDMQRQLFAVSGFPN